MKLLLISVKSTVSRGDIAVWTDRFLAGCGKQNMEVALVNTEAVDKVCAYYTTDAVITLLRKQYT